MSRTGDGIPLVGDQLLDDVELSIRRLLTYNDVAGARGVVEKCAQVTNESVPPNDASSMLRFLSDMRDGKLLEGMVETIQGISVGGAKVIAQEGVLREMNIPSFSKSSSLPAGAAQEIREAYAQFKSMFPNVSVVKEFGEKVKTLNHVFENVVQDISLSHPASLLRFQLTGDVEGQVDGSGRHQSQPAAANTMQAVLYADPETLTYDLSRAGTGAAASTAFSGPIYRVLNGGQMTFRPSRLYDANVLLEAVAGVKANVVNDTTNTVTLPTLTIYRAPAPGLPRVAVAAATPLSASATSVLNVRTGDVVWLDLAAVSAFGSVNDRAIEYNWDIGWDRDTAQMQTVITAVASGIKWSNLDRGLALSYLGMWNKYLLTKGVTDLVVTIRNTYFAAGGAAADVAAVTANSFFDFSWWVGNDIRITNRNALAETWRRLHAFMASFLPFALMDGEFIQFLTGL